MKQALTYMLGIGLLVAGLWGCTAQDAAIIGDVSGPSADGNPNVSEQDRAVAASRNASHISEQQASVEAAEAGRSQVNVNAASGQNEDYYDGRTTDGGHYKGQIMNGLPHGFGTLIGADGRKYVGEFTNGFLNGQGTHTWPNGETYVGEFIDGWRSGEGTMHWLHGDKYVGEWSNDKPGGEGTMHYADSDTYVGEFIDGWRSGEGTMIYADGDTYVGEWRNGEYDGQGTMTYAWGQKYVGEWKNGKYDGQGTCTFADGTKWTGTFRNGRFRFKTEKTKTEPALLIYNKWDDVDEDGITEKSELVGLEKNRCNIGKEYSTIAFWNNSFIGTVVLKSWNAEGKVIRERECTFDEDYSLCRSLGPNLFPPGDFMDNGRYRVSAHYGDKEIIKDVEIVK
jgi:hypothetical protein